MGAAKARTGPQGLGPGTPSRPRGCGRGATNGEGGGTPPMFAQGRQLAASGLLPATLRGVPQAARAPPPPPPLLLGTPSLLVAPPPLAVVLLLTCCEDWD